MWFSSPDRTLVIAEVGQNHDGSLGTAHAYIDAIAASGADAVKFQTHIAAAESTLEEPWRKKFSYQDASRYDYWKRMEFSEEQWGGLAEHARERGLVFLSSAFSLQAVEMLERLGVPAWKVGAGEITSLPMLERMAETGKPVMLSSGLASWADLDAAVAVIRDLGSPVGIFQCTTMYPCPAEKLGLNILQRIRERYGCPVGLSDHSGTIFAGLAAAALGAEMLEVHVTFSKECFGPDVPASITTQELRSLVEGVRFVRTAIASPVEKDLVADELAELKTVFGKSVVTARSLPKGCTVSREDLEFRKPGNGIPAARYRELLNRRTRNAIPANVMLREEDLE